MPVLLLFLLGWLLGNLLLSIENDTEKEASCKNAENHHKPELAAGDSTQATSYFPESNHINDSLCETLVLRRLLPNRLPHLDASILRYPCPVPKSVDFWDSAPASNRAGRAEEPAVVANLANASSLDLSSPTVQNVRHAFVCCKPVGNVIA